MKLSQNQFNHFILQEVLRLRASNEVLIPVVKSLFAKLSPEGVCEFEEYLTSAIESHFQALCVSHPILDDSQESDLSTWLDQ